MRQIIRSVIKESFEETGWGGGDGNRVSVGEVLDHFEEKNIKPIDMNIEEVFYKLSNGEETLKVITSEGRVNAANLDYPIIVIKRNGEIEYALDGNHRLQKAKNAPIGPTQSSCEKSRKKKWVFEKSMHHHASVRCEPLMLNSFLIIAARGSELRI